MIITGAQELSRCTIDAIDCFKLFSNCPKTRDVFLGGSVHVGAMKISKHTGALGVEIASGESKGVLLAMSPEKVLDFFCRQLKWLAFKNFDQDIVVKCTATGIKKVYPKPHNLFSAFREIVLMVEADLLDGSFESKYGIAPTHCYDQSFSWTTLEALDRASRRMTGGVPRQTISSRIEGVTPITYSSTGTADAVRYLDMTVGTTSPSYHTYSTSADYGSRNTGPARITVTPREELDSDFARAAEELAISVNSRPSTSSVLQRFRGWLSGER